MDNTTLKVEEDVIEWFKEKVLSKIFEVLKKPYENATVTIKSPENCFFLSLVYFVNVELQSGQSIQLVIKKPSNKKYLIDMMHAKALFHNEILFFEEFAVNSTQFPRCYYTIECSADEFENTAIITENIESMGFKIVPGFSNFSLDYIICGIQEMARFHAMGYVIKAREPEKFSKIRNSLKEFRFLQGGWCETLTNITAIRPIKYLRKQNYDPEFCEKMAGHLKNAFDTVMLDAVKPHEPLAVLCHGDFTRNNIFYRSSESGLDAMLIDFAMVRYSSPAIDLSTFIYLNCSSNDIYEKFSVIFKAYHTTLIDYLQERGIHELEQYSYDRFLADYKRRVLFGYLVSIFFLPCQRGILAISEEDFKDTVLFSNRTIAAGDDELSKEYADRLLNLRDHGALDHILSP